tara:strand:- start:33614 stop:33832 length:219 start_codon:yes stop_codon:yes gene_type:complete
MKKVLNTLFGLLAVIVFLTSTNLNAACDTIPNVGDTVGICNTLNGPDYTVYTCSEVNEGDEFCFFKKIPEVD